MIAANSEFADNTTFFHDQNLHLVSLMGIVIPSKRQIQMLTKFLMRKEIGV